MNAINLARPGVTCGNLIKDYGSGSAVVHALRGVNIDINPGDVRSRPDRLAMRLRFFV
jgi:hypothetical protein